MNRTQIIIFCVTGLVTAAIGCTSVDVYDRAGALAVEVRQHRNRQADRVSKINADFDTRFTQLMEQYDKALADQLRQGRDSDAQQIADALIIDLEHAALRGSFRSAFRQTVIDQRRAITEADEAAAAARAAYETSYQQASLELKRLDKVHDLLLELANRPKDLAVASQAVRMSINAYDKALKAQQEESKSGGEEGESDSN